MEAESTRLEDSQVEFRARKLTREVADLSEGAWVGDIEVITGQEANPTVAAEDVPKVGPNQAQSAELDESNTNVNGGGSMEVRQEVRQERVVGAADERAVVRDIPEELSAGLSSAEIIRFQWYDVAHSASRIGHIALIPRYDMYVQVKDGLAGRRADIYSDVETIWMITLNDLMADPLNAFQQRALFFRGGVEPCCDMAPGDDQRVPIRHRKAVPEPEASGRLKDDLASIRGAEWAVARHGCGSGCRRWPEFHEESLLKTDAAIILGPNAADEVVRPTVRTAATFSGWERPGWRIIHLQPRAMQAGDRLIPGDTDQFAPFGPVRFRTRAVKQVGGDVGGFMAQDLQESRLRSGGQPGMQRDDSRL